jgi:hypothetical protein
MFLAGSSDFLPLPEQNHPAFYSSGKTVLTVGKSQWPRIIKIHVAHAAAIVLLFAKAPDRRFGDL